MGKAWRVEDSLLVEGAFVAVNIRERIKKSTR